MADVCVVAVARNCATVGVDSLVPLPLDSSRHLVATGLDRWPRIPHAAGNPWVREVQQEAPEPARL
jgi:hypothetical protein